MSVPQRYEANLLNQSRITSLPGSEDVRGSLLSTKWRVNFVVGNTSPMSLGLKHILTLPHSNLYTYLPFKIGYSLGSKHNPHFPTSKSFFILRPTSNASSFHLINPIKILNITQNPIKQWERIHIDSFSKKTYSQKVYEKINHQGSANQNHSEIFPHSC